MKIQGTFEKIRDRFFHMAKTGKGRAMIVLFVLMFVLKNYVLKQQENVIIVLEDILKMILNQQAVKFVQLVLIRKIKIINVQNVQQDQFQQNKVQHHVQNVQD
jgi:hypothetical protein